jgi:hypothetical protein
MGRQRLQRSINQLHEQQRVTSLNSIQFCLMPGVHFSQPSWIDVVDGANEQVMFVERSITLEMKGAIVSALVEPIENGQDRRLHMFFLVGSPGSGKTTLVRRIAAMLVEEGRIVVADAGLDVHEPSASPEEYIESLFQIVAHGRPVILLLDDPLYSDSPWIAILKKLNRPGLRISVLAACPQMLFDSHKGRLVFGVVKHLIPICNHNDHNIQFHPTIE